MRNSNPMKVRCPDEFFDFIGMRYGSKVLYNIKDLELLKGFEPDFLYVGRDKVCASKNGKMITIQVEHGERVQHV